MEEVRKKIFELADEKNIKNFIVNFVQIQVI